MRARSGFLAAAAAGSCSGEGIAVRTRTGGIPSTSSVPSTRGTSFVRPFMDEPPMKRTVGPRIPRDDSITLDHWIGTKILYIKDSRSKPGDRSRRCLHFQRRPCRRPLTPPAPLSPRERGEKDQRELLFFSLLPPGERRGRGGEGAGGATTLKPKRRAGSVKEADNVPTALRCSGRLDEEGFSMSRIAIQGFGRVGRCTLRAALKERTFTPAAIADVKDLPTLAALFAVDTNYGRWPEPVRAEGDVLRIGERAIPYHNVSAGLPDWGALGIDVVIESSRRATTRAGAQPHL